MSGNAKQRRQARRRNAREREYAQRVNRVIFKFWRDDIEKRPHGNHLANLASVMAVK